MDIIFEYRNQSRYPHLYFSFSAYFFQTTQRILMRFSLSFRESLD